MSGKDMRKDVHVMLCIPLDMALDTVLAIQQMYDIDDRAGSADIMHSMLAETAEMYAQARGL